MSAARTAAEELAQAARHDEAGEHDQAVNALARATRLGDVEATTQLGKRLLVGDRAPCLPQDAVSFLVDAYNKGGGEAAARLAVLSGLGAYVEHNLDSAIMLLAQAAERGWARAQEQLRVLTPDRALAELAERPADYWRRLSRSIDPEFWLTAPPGRNLNDSPTVRVFERFLPTPVCAWLIEQSVDKLERALVYDPVGGQDIADHTRTNTQAQFDLVGTEVAHVLMQIRMSVSCGLPLHNMESSAVLHYGIGEQITNHFDFVNPKIPNYAEEIAKNGQRVVTFIIYLNDDYDGGETDFPKLEVAHKGPAGGAIYFINALSDGEPDLRTVHAGRPPTRGEKWIVTQFGRNRTVLDTAPAVSRNS